MIHPVFMTALRRPDLVAAHLNNYADLVKCELSALGISLVTRVVAAVIAVVALFLALGLTGVALMFGYVQGYQDILVVVPGVAWVVAVVSAVYAARSTTKERVDEVKEEMSADLELLRMVKEAKNV